MRSILMGPVFAAALLCLSTVLMAGEDKADGDFVPADWTGVSSDDSYAYFVDSTTNKPDLWESRSYLADDEHIADHAKKENNDELDHYHYKNEYGDDGSCPSAAEADAYWNARFREGDKTTKLSGAVKKHKTCHEWALSTSGRATGVYDHTLTAAALNDVYGNDVTSIDADEVGDGDILTYGNHSTYVLNTRANGSGGTEPKTLQWKWLASGVYQYTTPDNGVNEYDTPMCHTGFESDVDEDKTMPNQGWSWDIDYKSSPTVWH